METSRSKHTPTKAHTGRSTKNQTNSQAAKPERPLWTHEEAAEVVANLRTLSTAPSTELASRTDEVIGPIRARLVWEDDDIDAYARGEARRRNLDAVEMRLDAVIGATQEALLAMRLGKTCDGEHLGRLADGLEAAFAERAPHPIGDAGATGGGTQPGYEVPWIDELPDGWIPNSEAVTLAHACGNEYELPELSGQDVRGLNKLLRRRDVGVRFMSKRTGKPAGRVHKADWQNYLRRERDRVEATEEAIETRAREIAS
jgi:hypothetical protein